MSGLRLEDRMGRRLELYEPTTFDGEKGAVFRSSFIDDAIVVHLDPNQAAILHAKLGEMLGASAEEKFADRIDRLEMAISSLLEAVAKLAPQAALDALAEAFTAEMAKVKVRLDPVLIALAKAPIDDLPESDEERAAVADAKHEPLLRMPLVTSPHGYGALTREESRLFRAIEDAAELPLSSYSRVLPDVDVNTALVQVARDWWHKVAKPAIEAAKKESNHE